MIKKWYLSKTLIFNVLTTIGGVLAAFQASDWIMQNPQISAIVLSGIGLVNFGLRIFTSEPIK